LHTNTFKNTLLKTLDSQIITRLRLQPITFEVQHEIEFPGTPIEHLFFVEEGVASMTTTFEDGSQVEVGMFGYQSVIGISALMGTKRSLNRVYTQIAGSGYACPIEAARKEFLLCEDFQALALRYVQAQLVQATQTAGCNAKHDVEQRLARWLLICADRAGSNTFGLSHQFLANMLGTSRPTVSLAAGVFFGYQTPTDFRLEVPSPSALPHQRPPRDAAQDAELKRRPKPANWKRPSSSASPLPSTPATPRTTGQRPLVPRADDPKPRRASPNRP
jgi:CRP-like cAMP-binding protein